MAEEPVRKSESRTSFSGAVDALETFSKEARGSIVGALSQMSSFLGLEENDDKTAEHTVSYLFCIFLVGFLLHFSKPSTMFSKTLTIDYSPVQQDGTDEAKETSSVRCGTSFFFVFVCKCAVACG